MVLWTVCLVIYLSPYCCEDNLWLLFACRIKPRDGLSVSGMGERGFERTMARFSCFSFVNNLKYVTEVNNFVYIAYSGAHVVWLILSQVNLTGNLSIAWTKCSNKFENKMPKNYLSEKNQHVNYALVYFFKIGNLIKFTSPHIYTYLIVFDKWRNRPNCLVLVWLW